MVTFTLDNRNEKEIYDVKESFHALDTQKTGSLKFELAYTLLLGLGYITDHRKKHEFSLATLEEAAKRIQSVENDNTNGADLNSGIKLDTLLTIIATVGVFLNSFNLLPNEIRIRTVVKVFLTETE